MNCDTVTYAAKKVRSVQMRILAMENGASIVGLDKLADELRQCAIDLQNVSDSLFDIGGEIAAAEMQHVESSQNILNAALAGVDIAKQREREGAS